MSRALVESIFMCAAILIPAGSFIFLMIAVTGVTKKDPPRHPGGMVE